MSDFESFEIASPPEDVTIDASLAQAQGGEMPTATIDTTEVGSVKGFAIDLLTFYRENVSVPVFYNRFGQICFQEAVKGESCSVYTLRQFQEQPLPAAVGRSALRIASCNKWNIFTYLKLETP